MDILKTAIDWTKAETLSCAVFIVFGLFFVLTSLGFWQLGKTDVAKAFVFPTLIAGTLLLILGVGLIIPNQMRLTDFPVAFSSDASAFVATELVRVEKTMGGYETAVFRVFPIIIAVCAVLTILLSTPVWRASLITIMAMMTVLMLVDINANARLEAYKAKLQEAKQSS